MPENKEHPILEPPERRPKGCQPQDCCGDPSAHKKEDD